MGSSSTARFKKVFRANPINVGVEVGLYGQGVEAAGREKMFGRLEEAWPRLRAKLIDGDVMKSEERDSVALFLAFQLVRTPEHFSEAGFVVDVCEYAGNETVSREIVSRFLEERHLGFCANDQEVEGAWTIVQGMINMPGPLPTRDDVMAMSLDVAMGELAPRLCRRAWTVERCRKRVLTTSDRPVSYWARPTPLDRVNGLGLEGAEEVRFPLDPQHLLVLRSAGVSYNQEVVETEAFYGGQRRLSQAMLETYCGFSASARST